MGALPRIIITTEKNSNNSKLEAASAAFLSPVSHRAIRSALKVRVVAAIVDAPQGK
jgi:hypothetical protein